MKKYLLTLSIALLSWQCAVNVNSVEIPPGPGGAGLNNGETCKLREECKSNNCSRDSGSGQCVPASSRECFRSASCGSTASYACLNNILECFTTESECSASPKCGTVADLSLASFTASAPAAEGDGTNINFIVFTVELNRNVVFGDDEVSFTYRLVYGGGAGKAEEGDIDINNITTSPELASGKIIIRTEKNKATITVPIKRDEDNNEGPESFDITIENLIGFTAADNDLVAAGMITADPLTAAFADPAEAAAESGAIEFTVQLNRNVIVTDGEVSFTYSPVYGSGSGKDDPNDIGTIITSPAVANGKTTIAVGSNSATITVPIVSDLIGEAQESFDIRIGDLSGFTAADRTAAGTIAADPLVATFSGPTAPATEGGAIEFTVQLNRPVDPADVVANSGNDVSFTYLPVYGSGSGKADSNDIGTITTMPAASGTTVTIGRGVDKATITVPIASDSAVESAETFDITITPTGFTAAPNTDLVATGTISADPTAPLVATFEDPDPVTEGGNIVFTVQLNRPVAGTDSEVSFTYTLAYSAGQAESADIDVNGISTVPELADGKTTILVNSDSATITVPIVNEMATTNESAETFAITIENLVGFTTTDPSATGTIKADPLLATFSGPTASATEGTSIVFTVLLNRPVTAADNEVSFRHSPTYGSGDGQAVAGDIDDVVGITTMPPAADGKTTFIVGSNSATISVPILNDSISEAQETFGITISSLSGFTAVNPSATGTITADPLTAAFADPTAATDEGNSIEFTVQLNRPVAGTDGVVSFMYALTYSAGQAEAADIDAVVGISTMPPVAGGKTTIATGSDSATITVPIATDSISEAQETFTVTITPTGFNSNNPISAVGTIAADSLALASFTALAAAAEGSSIVFTVELNRPVAASDNEVSFTFTTSTPGGTGKADSDDIGTITTSPGLANGKTTFAVGSRSATIIVPIEIYGAGEGAETFDITITPTGFSAAADNDLVATGTILADTLSSLSAIAFRDPSAQAEGGSIEFIVQLNRDVASGDGEVSFTYSTSTPGGTGKAEAADIGAISTSPAAADGKTIIPVGESSATITVPIKSDMADGNNREDQETFEVTINLLSGFTAADPSAVGTITADNPDGDTFTGSMDNCPLISTTNQGNIDNDGDTYGDACDVDDDGDGLIEIETKEELNSIRYDLKGASYKTSDSDTGTTTGCGGQNNISSCSGYELSNDITLVDNWTPVQGKVDTSITTRTNCTNAKGYWASSQCTIGFTGTFNGNDKTIRNLTINDNSVHVGFFSILSGTVKNLNFRGSSVTSTNTSSGIVGTAAGASDGILDKVSSDLSVTAGDGNGDYVGGLVGRSYGTIKYSYATGNADGGAGDYDSVGGLVGYNRGGTIQNSYATGNADGGAGDEDSVGGLVGYASGTIRNSYATGNVDGGDGSGNVGGLVGLSYGTIKNSYATGNADGGGGFDVIGGLVGQNDGTIENSYATGNADGGDAYHDSVGGLVGYNGDTGTIQNSYATGNADGGDGGTDFIGGLVGRNYGTIENSYYSDEAVLSGEVPNMLGTSRTLGQLRSLDVAQTVSDFGAANAWSEDNWDFGTSGQYPTLLSYKTNTNDNQIRGEILCGQPGAASLPQVRKPCSDVNVNVNDLDGDGILNDDDIDADGDGLIEIETKEELYNIRYDLTGASYKTSSSDTGTTTGCYWLPACSGYELLNDITLSENWVPVQGTFTGTLDGNDNSISNMIINDNSVNVGFFSILSGTVRSLHFSVSSGGTGSITGTRVGIGKHIGAVAATLGDNGVLDNVSSDLPIIAIGESHYTRIGGLVGRNNSGTIQRSYAMGRVSGDGGNHDFVGRLVGENNSGTLQSSYYSNEAVLSGENKNTDGTAKTLSELRSLDAAQTETDFAAGRDWDPNNWDFGVSGTHYPSVRSIGGVLLCAQPGQGTTRVAQPGACPQ